MPRLIGNAGNFLFIGRIANDKTVLRAVCGHPLRLLRVGKFAVKLPVRPLLVDDVKRHTRLMLGSAGGLHVAVIIAHAFHAVVVHDFLCAVGTVRRIHIERIAGRLRPFKEPPKRLHGNVAFPACLSLDVLRSEISTSVSSGGYVFIQQAFFVHKENHAVGVLEDLPRNRIRPGRFLRACLLRRKFRKTVSSSSCAQAGTLKSRQTARDRANVCFMIFLLLRRFAPRRLPALPAPDRPAVCPTVLDRAAPVPLSPVPRKILATRLHFHATRLASSAPLA